ncbi:unnamed protein product [Anisakis simplex]|uniref:S1 motif domain-containing protein n=1 Tax=Anisakis simplex TaxID=6269 RepID=A0A0M3JEW8_ANISI|nr:unnamed protein product [Anisakis simplex]
MPDLEIDFPRGGTNQNSSSNDGKSGKEALKNRKRRRVDGSKPRSEFDTKDAKRSEYEGVWRNRMDSSQLTEGVLGLGAVREIHDDRIEVESSDGILFTLPATNISDQLTNTFKSSALFTLNDIFVVGQMIAFKVVKIVSTDSSGVFSSRYYVQFLKS